MTPIKEKYKAVLSSSEVADMLRALADDLESGKVSVSETPMEIEKDHGLNVSYTQDFKKDAFRFKIKYKGHSGQKQPVAGHDEPVPEKEKAEAADTGRSSARTAPPRSRKESYSKLKKRMKKDFKAIQVSLSTATIPEADLMQRFIDDSRAMTTYRGKGNPHYPEYNQTTDTFERAWKEEDIPLLVSAADELERQKKVCHDEFK